MSLKMSFTEGSAIEIAFATVKTGKEDQLFGSYFPKVTPIVQELGGQPMGSFMVERSSSKIGNPKMGSFFNWPSVETFKQLHNSPGFLEIVGIRDDALDFFVNGNFFAVDQNTDVAFSNDKSYALVSFLDAAEESLTKNALLELKPMTPEQSYAPGKIALLEWDEAVSAQLNAKTEGIEIFKIKLNMPS